MNLFTFFIFQGVSIIAIDIGFSSDVCKVAATRIAHATIEIMIVVIQNTLNKIIKLI